MTDDLYEILGVDPDSSDTQIRAAYRDAARRSHPDQPGVGERDHAGFTSIVDAWAILGDPSARAEYDAARRSSVAERVVAIAAGPIPLYDRQFSQQLRRTFTAAIIVVASMLLVLFVIGMSQSGGG